MGCRLNYHDWWNETQDKIDTHKDRLDSKSAADCQYAVLHFAYRYASDINEALTDALGGHENYEAWLNIEEVKPMLDSLVF